MIEIILNYFLVIVGAALLPVVVMLYITTYDYLKDRREYKKFENKWKRHYD